ncbi:MAG: aspartate aminotransferase family protein [Pseudomonadota bacterium]
MKTHVFHRDLNMQMPIAKTGKGATIIDAQGRHYIDASGGAAVSNIGHDNQNVRAAMHAQIDQLAFAHTAFFTSEPAENLANFLVTHAPGEMETAYFVSSGSEAIETALKMARQYFVEKGEDYRRYFIARQQSYHGNTLGALALGGNEWRKKKFNPLLSTHARVSPCYPYRNQLAGESDEEYANRLADELEQQIITLGAKNVIAFVCETVSGATLGAQPAVKNYFKKIKAICKAYGILLILDEIMCGMGRTGSLFAYEQEHITPDMVAIAKGLGGGYQPIGAVLCHHDIFESFVQGSGVFTNGHTYLGHPVACATALAVQQEIQKNHLLTNVCEMGQYMHQKLCARFLDHPNVGDIRGRGLFWAIEFVKNKKDKTPFDPTFNLHLKLKKHAMEQGLICYPNGGTIDGRLGDHVLLAPPFIADQALVDEIIERLYLAFETALSSCDDWSCL